MTEWGKRGDIVIHTDEPFNAEAPLSALAGPLTDVDAFYSRNHGPIPDLDPATWTLRIEGLVDAPVTLTRADLAQFDEVTLAATLQCAGNRRAELQAFRAVPGEAPWGPGATSTATWTGVRLADVLATVGMDDGVAHVEFRAPDVAPDASPPQGFGGSIELSKALAGEVLLAWAMNGEPLTRVHGAPVRVIVPGHIGARSVKWVDRIVLRRDPSPNWFQAHAYRLVPADGDYARDAETRGLALGPVAVNAAILSPAPGTTVDAGPLPVAGYAFAGRPPPPPGGSAASTSRPTAAGTGSRPSWPTSWGRGRGGTGPRRSTSPPGPSSWSCGRGTRRRRPAPHDRATCGTRRATSTAPGPGSP